MLQWLVHRVENHEDLPEILYMQEKGRFDRKEHSAYSSSPFIVIIVSRSPFGRDRVAKPTLIFSFLEHSVTSNHFDSTVGSIVYSYIIANL